jgi:hypothetical protein
MKIFYHHIPRTGGTSIAKIAEKNYKKNFFIWHQNCLDDILKTIENRNNFFILCDSLYRENDVKKILDFCDTSLISIRNPILRFESLYNIWIDNNPKNSPYDVSDKNLSIDDFYLYCKKTNKELFLNIQHKYLNLYNPQKIIITENFEQSIKKLKNIDVFNEINEEDLIPSNISKSNFKLSAKNAEDYQNNFFEDFEILRYG